MYIAVCIFFNKIYVPWNRLFVLYEINVNFHFFFYALRWNKLIFHCSSIFFTTVKNIIVIPVFLWRWRCFVPRHTSMNTNVTFIKLGTNDVNMMTSWCYCLPRYNIFVCFSLKKQNICWIFGVRLKIISLVIIKKSYFILSVRIRIRVRNILTRTPHSMFQYPSNLSFYMGHIWTEKIIYRVI